MSTTLSRVLIATALLGGTAYAGKRVAILDFDGPRALAETGRDAVVRARAYVRAAIAAAPGYGAGHGPLDHGITFDPSRLPG